MRPPNSARSRWHSAAANIDLPLPPEPTSAMLVGRAAAMVRARVFTSALRPFMPRGRGGQIERQYASETLAFYPVFYNLGVSRTRNSTHCDKISEMDCVERSKLMCRNIKTLFNFEPPATEA